MKHGRARSKWLFQVRGLAAALLLLAGTLILSQGIHGLSAPRLPWGLGRLELAAAAAADEQQQQQQQRQQQRPLAAALAAAMHAQWPRGEQQQQPQPSSAVLLDRLGASSKHAVLPPRLPPLHEPGVQSQESEEQDAPSPPPPQHRQQRLQGEQRQQTQQQQQREERQAAPTAREAPPAGQDRAALAMCIAVKDEHCDMREWVLHHAQLGAGKFYVFDTGSDPPMEPVLQDLIASGLVHYSYLTNTTKQVQLEPPAPGRSIAWQRPIYSLCLQRYGKQHRWMGFIDADEFVVLEDGVESLPALLSGYEQHGGLGLHWQLFAFDRHVERPAGGLLASYTVCCGREAHAGHRHIKSFVQPRYTMGPQTVHSFNYRKGRHAVNTGGARIDGPLLKPGQQVSYRGAVLHHYISRSLADFAVKQERRDGTGNVKQLSDLLGWHRKCTERCTAAVPLGQQLAARYDLSLNVPPRCLLTER